jgi:hypothetical protein
MIEFGGEPSTQPRPAIFRFRQRFWFLRQVRVVRRSAARPRTMVNQHEPAILTGAPPAFVTFGAPD